MIRNLFTLLTLLSLVTACNDQDCLQNKACSENPPTDELCEMAAQRWFYDSKTSECELIGYSGCEIYGFATKEECEKCDCE